MPEKSRLQPPASLGLAPTLLDRLASQGSLTRGEKKEEKKRKGVSRIKVSISLV